MCGGVRVDCQSDRWRRWQNRVPPCCTQKPGASCDETWCGRSWSKTQTRTSLSRRDKESVKSPCPEDAHDLLNRTDIIKTSTRVVHLYLGNCWCWTWIGSRYDSVVMICWIAFMIMTTMIERYLGLKRWLVTTYRRFKPTHDARSPWRVVNERLPSPDFTPFSFSSTPPLVEIRKFFGTRMYWAERRVRTGPITQMNARTQVESWIWTSFRFGTCPGVTRSTRSDRLMIVFDSRKIRVLVCGGDGTVAWVPVIRASEHSYKIFENLSLVILPLGTGNDLHVLWVGWILRCERWIERILGELLRAHEVRCVRRRRQSKWPQLSRNAIASLIYITRITLESYTQIWRKLNSRLRSNTGTSRSLGCHCEDTESQESG